MNQTEAVQADHETLTLLEQSLREVALQRGVSVKVNNFELFLADSDDFFLNSALPLTRPHNWDSAVTDMKEAFLSRGRRPRLEYFEECHPGLAAALEAQGFQRDMHAPVMTLHKHHLSAAPSLSSGRYQRLELEADLARHLKQQSIAYGGDGGDGALLWLPTMLQGVRENTVMVAALSFENCLVSGASMQIGGGLGELAGVWTIPDQQQKGFAYRLCQQLLADYFTDYERCWLSAAEGALRLYEKLGFKRVGTQLNYSLPL